MPDTNIDLSTPKGRVHNELHELNLKIEGLRKFMNNVEAFNKLSDIQKALLQTQYKQMEAYAITLELRLRYWN